MSKQNTLWVNLRVYELPLRGSLLVVQSDSESLLVLLTPVSSVSGTETFNSDSEFLGQK